jgi:hypothetical protein
LLALAVVLTGCDVYRNFRRTTCVEPHQFNWQADRHRSLKVYRNWAAAAWQAECPAVPVEYRTDQYELGFTDGFLDYVYAGGSGEPPPVPPRPFWNVALRSPADQALAQQWFDGFRHGAAIARDGGYRERTVLQSSLGQVAPEIILPEGLPRPAPMEELEPPSIEEIEPAAEPLLPLDTPLNSADGRDQVPSRGRQRSFPVKTAQGSSQTSKFIAPTRQKGATETQAPQGAPRSSGEISGEGKVKRSDERF